MQQFQVILHVYDLSRGTARALSQPLLGFPIDIVPHTGIEVHGVEVFFGGGIQQMSHALVVQDFGLRPVRSNVIGHTTISRTQMQDFLASVHPRFTQQTYDVFRNNCNHFADSLARFLLDGRGIPQDIVGLPDRVLASPMGAMLGQAMSQMQQQMIPFNNAPPQPLMPTAPAMRQPATAAASAPVLAASSAGAGGQPPTLVQALKALEAKTPDHKQGYQALSTLNKILENIEAHPLEETYRRVPKTNARFVQTLGQFTTSPLTALGFEEDATHFVMTPQEEKWPRLLMGRKLVQASRKQRGLAWLKSLNVRNVEELYGVIGAPDKNDAFLHEIIREVFP